MARATPAAGAPATPEVIITRDELLQSFIDAGLLQKGSGTDGLRLVMTKGTTLDQFMSRPLSAFNSKSLQQILDEEQIRNIWGYFNVALGMSCNLLLKNVGTAVYNAKGIIGYRLSSATLEKMYPAGIAPAAAAAAPPRSPSPAAAPARDDISELLEKMKRIKISPDRDPVFCDSRIFALRYRGQELGGFVSRSTVSLFQDWYKAQDGSQREQELEGRLRGLVEAHNREVAERPRFTVDRRALAFELSRAQEGFNPTSQSGVNDIWEKPLHALGGYTLRQIGINGRDVLKWLKENGDLNAIVDNAAACAAYGPEFQVAYTAPAGAAAARGGTPARAESPGGESPGRGRRSPSADRGRVAWSPRAGGAADRGDDVDALLERMRAIRESEEPDKTAAIHNLIFRGRPLEAALGGPANFNVVGWLRADPDRLGPIEGRLRRVLNKGSPAAAAGAAVPARPPSPQRTPPAGAQEQKPGWGRWALGWFGR